MIWRELDNFSSGSVCLVLASEVYDEDDYIRDYDKFYEIAQKNGQTYNKSVIHQNNSNTNIEVEKNGK
jgi:hypothetical protein